MKYALSVTEIICSKKIDSASFFEMHVFFTDLYKVKKQNFQEYQEV